jgi:tetratricopeptide (TPR) repeat protein
MKSRSRSGLLAAVAVIGLGLGPALAVGTNDPPPPSQTPAASKPEPKAKTAKPKKKTKKEKRTDRQFLDGYRVAFNLIQAEKYDAAIAAFHALKQDDHPDVANYIGYASRKLGRYGDAQAWYERALAADPKHARTWQYYGMWHVEQGNMLKAEDHLARIRTICGGESCKEFTDLKGAMEGTVVY